MFSRCTCNDRIGFEHQCKHEIKIYGMLFIPELFDKRHRRRTIIGNPNNGSSAWHLKGESNIQSDKQFVYIFHRNKLFVRCGFLINNHLFPFLFEQKAQISKKQEKLVTNETLSILLMDMNNQMSLLCHTMKQQKLLAIFYRSTINAATQLKCMQAQFSWNCQQYLNTMVKKLLC